MIAERVWAAVLLAALAVCQWLFLRGRLLPSLRRRPRLAARLLLLFALPALVALGLAGRWAALERLPAEFDRLRALAVQVVAPDLPLWPLVGAIAAGTAIGGIFAAWRERRGKGWTLGNVEAVMPRTRGDLVWGVPLSLTAGVAEELFFRLAMPLLATIASGSAVAGFVLGTALFGLAHRYQGRVGMAATAVVGVVLSVVYLASGNLLLAMAMHALIDLNALVLRPLVAGRVKLRS